MKKKHHRQCVRLLSMFVLAAALLPAGPAAAADITDEQVDKTMKQITEWLLDRQSNEGDWEIKGATGDNHAHGSGRTALVMTALLYAGVSPQHPKMQKSIEYLRKTELMGTYQVGLHAHVYAHMNDAYLDDLRKVQAWLAAAAHPGKATYEYSYKDLNLSGGYRSGSGSYGSSDKKDKGWKFDHSNTQYGILGMWEAAKRGINTSDRYWEDVIGHFLKAQNENGGWGYRAGGDNSRETMTCAGLTALLVAQQQLTRNRSTPNIAVQKAIERGMGYLDSNFRKIESSHGSKKGGYHMIGYERVALGLGYKYFNGKDWFRVGVEHILDEWNKINKDNNKKKDKDSGDVVDPAFFLMFLSRGRVPVWITKLQVDKFDWNNRPNDVYFLNKALSEMREGEINWQVVNIDRSAEDLLSTPVAYLASDKALNLTDDQKKNLKRYLDLGGLLFCNPDNNSYSFADSVELLAKELYPQHPMKSLPKEHMLFNALFSVNPGSGRYSSVNNGARDLIILAREDVGFIWQSTPEKELTNRDQGKIGANLFVMAANRGVIPNRLVPRFEGRHSKASKSGSMKVVIPRYQGKGPIESAAWIVVGNRMYNDAGIEVTTMAGGENAVDLKDIGGSDAALVHLQGAKPVTLSKEEKDAIAKYVEAGGTVFIETVGGRGGFATAIEKQLRESLNARAVPMQPGDAVISGEGLKGGLDVSQIEYRRFTQVRMQFGRNPRIMAFYKDGQPVVLLSEEDLSLGALGVLHWGIVGYNAESARELMTNIGLYAHSRKKK